MKSVGRLVDTRLYDRALTAFEVQMMYAIESVAHDLKAMIDGEGLDIPRYRDCIERLEKAVNSPVNGES